MRSSGDVLIVVVISRGEIRAFGIATSPSTSKPFAPARSTMSGEAMTRSSGVSATSNRSPRKRMEPVMTPSGQVNLPSIVSLPLAVSPFASNVSASPSNEPSACSAETFRLVR